MGRGRFFVEQTRSIRVRTPRKAHLRLHGARNVFTLSFSMKNTAKPCPCAAQNPDATPTRPPKPDLRQWKRPTAASHFPGPAGARMPQALCERPEIGKIPRQNYIGKMLRQRTRRPAPCLRSRDNRGHFRIRIFLFSIKIYRKTINFICFSEKHCLHLPCRERPLRRTRK